jgi:K+-sensing histidine kinase KdpD
MQNAIKYSPEGGKIQVTCHYKPIKDSTTKFHGYLVTQITDEGKGFRVNKNLKKFSTFSQAGLNQTKHDSAGVGIGLSTAQTLTLYLGGQLSVKSSEKGTKAKFSVLVTDIENLASFESEIK